MRVSGLRQRLGARVADLDVRGGDRKCEQERRRDACGPPAAAHDARRPPRPEAARVLLGANPGPVDPRSHRGQDHRQQRDRDGHADDRDEHAGVADRAEERDRQHDERKQPDADRRPGEDDRRSGRLHRLDDRVLVVGAARVLLAPAQDDEQRVVDADAEAPPWQDVHERNFSISEVTQSLQRTPDQSANVSRLRSLAGGKSFRGSFSWIRPDGEDNVIEYLGTPITWRGKQYSIGIDRDITQWKRAEERLEALANERGTLLKEIYHRVNNNLQVVSSLLDLQARQVNDERFSELLRESQLRVRAMALVHERLYRSQNLSSIDFGEYLQGEIGELRLAFGRPGVTLLARRGADPVPDRTCHPNRVDRQ